MSSDKCENRNGEPVPPAGGVQFVGYPPVPEDRKIPHAGGELEVLTLFEQVVGKDPQAYLAGSIVYQVTEAEVLAFASAHVTRLQDEATTQYAKRVAAVEELEECKASLKACRELSAAGVRLERSLRNDCNRQLSEKVEAMRLRGIEFVRANELQSERDALKAEVERLNELLAKEGRHFDAVWQKGLDLQSGLTKARELVLKLANAGSQASGFPSQLMREARVYLAHQSAPAAKGGS